MVDDGSASAQAACPAPKAGYCLSWSDDAETDALSLQGDFGWEASMTSARVNGRKDFAAFADKVIRCTVTTQNTGAVGTFESSRTDSDCD